MCAVTSCNVPALSEAEYSLVVSNLDGKFGVGGGRSTSGNSRIGPIGLLSPQQCCHFQNEMREEHIWGGREINNSVAETPLNRISIAEHNQVCGVDISARKECEEVSSGRVLAGGGPKTSL